MNVQYSSTSQNQDLSKQLLTLNIIWGAMLFSLLVYLFIAPAAGKNIKVPMPPDVLNKLRMALYIVAIIELPLTRIIRKFVLSSKNPIKTRTGQLPTNQHFARYATAMIISLALSESIGIYGVILFWIGKNVTDLYLLLLIAAAAMISYRPKQDEILALAKEEENKA